MFDSFPCSTERITSTGVKGSIPRQIRKPKCSKEHNKSGPYPHMCREHTIMDKEDINYIKSMQANTQIFTGYQVENVLTILY